METFPNEPIDPPIWTADAMEKMMAWAVLERKASDIHIVSGQPVKIRVHGDLCSATKAPISPRNLADLLDSLTEKTGVSTTLSKGIDLDFSFTCRTEGALCEVLRFRGNITVCAQTENNQPGYHIAYRHIDGFPPDIKKMGIEPNLLQGMMHDKGLVLVAGTMGSGKSTLLASVLQHRKQVQPNYLYTTFESPIEFDLTGCPGEGLVVQSEIPKHFESFELAPRNSTRRNPNVILVGESRDAVTIEGVIAAAEVGAAAYTTVHTQSVPETLRRIIAIFPAEQQDSISSKLVGSLRMIVYQKLVPRIDKKGVVVGRIAVREWLQFSPIFRTKLLETNPLEFPVVIQEELEKNGMPFLSYAQGLKDRRLISKGTFKSMCREHAVFTRS